MRILHMLRAYLENRRALKRNAERLEDLQTDEDVAFFRSVRELPASW